MLEKNPSWYNLGDFDEHERDREVDDYDEDADFFQRATYYTRAQRIRAFFVLCTSVFFFYQYILPILPGFPIELTLDGLRGTPIRQEGYDGRPCPHMQSRERLQGYLRNAEIASKGQSRLSSQPLTPLAVEEYFEKLFLTIPSAERAKENLKNITSTTHVAGTKADYNSAINLVKEWGNLLDAKLPEDITKVVYEAGSSESRSLMTSNKNIHKSKKGNDGIVEPQIWIDTYNVWLNYPISSSLLLSRFNETDRPYFRASLTEEVIPQDPTSADGLPAFHGYSKSGKASGQVVYAALCTRKDFDRLEELGISVKDKITLCRYGGPFRGLKVRESAVRGAVGTLIYTDPNEDQIITQDGVESYPDGPARAPSSIQRGSVQALSIYPGDPATPGKPSYRNASRLDSEKADSLPKIPSLPISYKEAIPFLQAISGKGKEASEVGEGWKGAIPEIREYWTGPSNDIVQMDNQMTDIAETKDIWNAYVKIPGIIKDEIIIVSNHRDAWGFGAIDPSSGTATLHEVVAGLGALLKTGWRPLRTILIASWDAEEYGLVGSTEAAEDYPDFFKENASIFLNLDMPISGSVAASNASPSLIDLIIGAASEIADPSGNGTKITLAKEPGPLGSGSDYTAYLQNLGIASAELNFYPKHGDAVYHYHSNYDSFHWVEKFGDPTFSRHHAMAQWFGLVLLRSVQGILLPLNVAKYADALYGYLDKVKKVAPKELNLGKLEESIKAVSKQARAFQEERVQVELRLSKALSLLPQHLSQKHKSNREIKDLLTQARSINKRAKAFETNFLSKDGKGLTKRRFYQHLGVAPGRYLGYGATTFPGLTESITLDSGKDMQHELDRLVEVLDSVKEALKV